MDFIILKPNLLDIPEMRNLILPEVQKGVILDRSEDEIANAIRSYSIVRNEKGEIIAFCALHIHSMILGEVRSLNVREDCRRKGIATMLIKSLIDEAKNLYLKEILTLTYKRVVFEKLGFKEIEKEKLPNHKIWADCIKCIRFPICDEIALIKTI
ncbi:GNAT family N-acetyltransferase [Helicobacter sp. 16-1353]|uniref:N-acetyltransferase n=1 Tax=Helicobacter sp. 16-1353 TaxID=2004996 RepID=UPI000DCC62D6|nr:N-acetyltransferase [Helicobacter sp. 16-1353]RAX54673.1 GNAT family N-acetyltransferase [Helicobacter sp. 16-1353]